jgi:hypothetical protein
MKWPQAKMPEANPKSKIPNPKLRWRRRQDSNLWYPFGVQRFSKPPLSATQPRLRILAEKPDFYSSGGANFVKAHRIIQPNDTYL